MSTHYKDYYGTHMPFGQFPKFGVLSSVKVLMTGTNIAGPFAASIMAEMGAQVIQVEAPNMPCQTRGNYGYSQDHRNTYSITLNTRTAGNTTCADCCGLAASGRRTSWMST